MLAVLFCFLGPSSAAISGNPTPGDVSQQIETTRKTRAALQAVRDALDRELAGIERRYGALARTIAELEAEARAREQRMVALKQKRDKLQASIKQQQKILVGQLRSAHIIGRRDWLKLLMNQEDPTKLARMMAYYGYLNQARAGLIAAWQEAILTARNTESALFDESSRQAATRQKLTRERAALAESGRARHALLVGWDQELRNKDEMLDHLEEDERNVQSLIRSVEPGTENAETMAPPDARPGPYPSGPARCPPAGPIVAKFGSPRMNGRWDGILIAGLEGAPVRASAGGRIVFADWLRGYGLMIIIDHNDGVMSLYAFNQSLYKGVGDAVSPGDVIAALGASGGRPKPGLYFGIRERGQPVDPVAWCANKG
jgi:septal ring factor EnvC (AmiA/AmiB activator)